MSYTVTAYDGGKTVTATRTRPASACVLARKWSDAGLNDVRIHWGAESYDLRGLFAKFVLTNGRLKPRIRDIRTW